MITPSVYSNYWVFFSNYVWWLYNAFDFTYYVQIISSCWFELTFRFYRRIVVELNYNLKYIVSKSAGDAEAEINIDEDLNERQNTSLMKAV